MISVTDKAVEVLDNLRADAVASSGETPEEISEPVLRLVIQGNQASITLDAPTAEDQVVARDNHTVLVIDQELATALDGATIDIVDTPEGQRLAISS
ncbi:MAG: hypothetical protein ACYC1C_01890 [Chloroflexota bacterium]